jgi:uncharacterized repeat protein (TIGR03803 family)
MNNKNKRQSLMKQNKISGLLIVLLKRTSNSIMKRRFPMTNKLKIKHILYLLASFQLCSATTVNAVVTFNVLHQFNGLDGAAAGLNNTESVGTIVEGNDGNLYGTTPGGGSDSVGVFFRISPAGTYTVLREFVSTVVADPGGMPQGLHLGRDGSLYGSTRLGLGVNEGGTVYKMSLNGAKAILHNFTSSEGCAPSTPVQGLDGSLYGTTLTCSGTSTTGTGTVYKITPGGIHSILHKFNNDAEGNYPLASLVLGKDGNLYGTTSMHGLIPPNRIGYGTVFRITPSGAFKTLHVFDNNKNPGDGVPDGIPRHAPLLQGNDGNFYGTTTEGGIFNGGTIFKITPAGIFSIIHNFDQIHGSSQGYDPEAGLIQASDGNFYGTTRSRARNNLGVVFRITPSGVYTVIKTFNSVLEGGMSASPLVQHTNGFLYSASDGLGLNNAGNLYRIGLGLPATILAIPNTAKAGSKIGIYGNFTGATGIKFNGVSALLTGTSNTSRIATVPAGPATGRITITKATGTLTSSKPFLVLPTFTSFAPLSGRVGSDAALNGVSLSQTSAVYYTGVSGLIKTTYTVVNDRRVNAVVPVGAKTGRIYVVTLGGIAASAVNYTILP